MSIMDIINIINAGVLIIGLPVLLKAAFYIGKRLQVLDNLENIINNQILPDIKDIRERLASLETKLSTLETKVNITWDWLSRHMILDPQNK